METELICIGCGASIQTEDPSQPGYLPRTALEREPVICQRCFRLKHYNDITDVSLSDDDFLRMLNEIGNSDALIVKVVDIFDFNGSWVPGIHRFTRGQDVLLVGNKVDVLPKSCNKNKVMNWLKKQAKELGLHPVDCILVSAEKGIHIKEAIALIEKYREGKDVYVVGCTNVGKSTFINRIIKEVTGTGEVITTSHFPGTTLGKIEIPLDDGRSIIDTPGIINRHQMAHLLNKKDLKLAVPKKEIKPKVYQLNEKQTMFFAGLARLDYIKGGRTSFTCYFSNEMQIHRTKLEKADALYENHLGGLLSPPREEDLEHFPPLVRQEFLIKDRKTDIVFSGLGWVTVNEAPVVVAAYVPKGIRVYLRTSLI